MLTRDYDLMVAVQRAHQDTALAEIRQNQLVRAAKRELRGERIRRPWLSGALEALTHNVSCTLSPAAC
jgi:hypothetical protein